MLCSIFSTVDSNFRTQSKFYNVSCHFLLSQNVYMYYCISTEINTTVEKICLHGSIEHVSAYFLFNFI